MTLQGGGRRHNHFLGAGHLRLLRGLCAQSHLRQASTIRSVQLPNTSFLLHFIRLIQTLNQYSWQCSGPLPQIAQLHRVSTNIRTGGQKKCAKYQSNWLCKCLKYCYWYRFVDPWMFLEFWLFKSLHKTLSPSGGRQISTGKNIRKYPQANMMIFQTAGNKCVKITKH